MEVPLSASLLSRGALLYPQGVPHGPWAAQGEVQILFLARPLARCVTWYKSLTPSLSLRARELLKHSPLSPVSQPVSYYRLDNRTELCHLSEESGSQLLIFSDMIESPCINPPEAQRRWCDFSLYLIKKIDPLNNNPPQNL